MPKVIVLRALDKCLAYELSWEKLVRDMEYPSPFVQPGWIFTAMKSNAHKWSPYILLVLEGRELIGVLPLYQNKANDLYRELRFVGDCYYPDPLGVICESENLSKCINALKKHLNSCCDWDVLCLQWLLEKEAKVWEGSRVISNISSIAPYIPLPENFQLYLKEFKKKINFAIRKVKKFDKSNGKYYSTQCPDKSKRLLEKLFALHEQRSEEKGIKSSFCGDVIFNFHNSIIELCDNVYMHWLAIDNRIIAILYGFMFHGRFFYFQIAHDPKYGGFSPGAVLLFKAIEQCCGDRQKEFNFLQGGEAYKWKWTKDSRRLYIVKMYNYSTHGLLLEQKDKIHSAVKTVFTFIKLRIKYLLPDNRRYK